MLALKRISSSAGGAGLRSYSSSGYASTAKNLKINSNTKVIYQGLSICRSRMLDPAPRCEKITDVY